VRLQLADPAEHPDIGLLPFGTGLASWQLANVYEVTGLHRHVVRLVELGEGSRRRSYVVKELPDHLVLREFRLLRGLAEDGLPTVDVVAAVTERTDDRDGLLVTRHLDYALPYRSLLSGRGLRIPYLGERLLDALVGLLVRLHLAGFFWGDCSLSNTLFRRDAGALMAYVIDVETSERYPSLTDGQRQMDLDIAAENVAGGLLDLQAGGRLVADVDPWEVATNIERGYGALWDELTAAHEFNLDELWRVEQRVERLHELGFDVAEMDVVTDVEGDRLKVIPRVVEAGYHEERLAALTGLAAGENQARRLLGDIRSYGTELRDRHGKSLPENIVAVRWLDQRFEPAIAAIPPELLGKLQAAEIYHQILEHRWFLSERESRDVPMEEAIEAYIAEILSRAPDEQVRLDATIELPVIE
jgi:Domain of unknown function (DUF4032)/Lipopolysaccharide kinase (Kdo/WaaP) family